MVEIVEHLPNKFKLQYGQTKTRETNNKRDCIKLKIFCKQMKQLPEWRQSKE
jgi:hypothetical protein